MVVPMMLWHPKRPGYSAFDDQAAAKPWFKKSYYHYTYCRSHMQWEDAQIVYPVTDKRQISPKVGRQGWIVGAPTSFLKPTIGQASTSWKILPVVLCALVSTMINSAPFPTPSCHLQSAAFKYPTVYYWQLY